MTVNVNWLEKNLISQQGTSIQYPDKCCTLNRNSLENFYSHSLKHLEVISLIHQQKHYNLHNTNTESNSNNHDFKACKKFLQLKKNKNCHSLQKNEDQSLHGSH